jgi:hypothetical protein
VLYLMTIQMWNTSPILQHIRKHRTFVSDYQGDLGVKLLLQNLLKQESVLFWYWNYRTWRTAWNL